VKRTVLLSSLICILVLAGLAAFNGVLLALALPLVLFVATALFLQPGTVNVTVRRVLSEERVMQGTAVSVTLTIVNEGDSLATVTIQDLVPAGLAVTEGEAATATTLPAGAAVELTYTLSGPRGYYRWAGVAVTAVDALGLIHTEKQIDLESRLFVLPPVDRLPHIPIRPRRTRIYPGVIPINKGGPGQTFYGIREYHSGDAMRWLNHRVSARHEQKLFVNEFELERAGEVGIILDVRQVTNVFEGGESILEHSIAATASLSDAFLAQGNRVGLFIYGGSIDWVLPGYGKIQRERILRALAHAEPQSHQVFEKLYYLPTNLFPVRSQLVLISPLLPDDLPDVAGLRARGYQVLVVAPDPVHFEQRFLQDTEQLDLALRIARLERRILMRGLRQSGVQVVEWQVDKPFFQSARYALSRLPVGFRGVRTL
jgi:uncharacterized protein (DUF58 family)